MPEAAAGRESRTPLREKVAALVGLSRLMRDRKAAARWMAKLTAGKASPEEILSRGWARLAIPVAEWLLTESFALRYSDPKRMVRLAELATKITEALNPGRYGKLVLADLLARSWAELASAYRIAEDYSKAEEAFGKAWSWLRTGTREPGLAGLLAELQATLYHDQRQFEKALELLATAENFYRHAGDVHAEGRVLIKRGVFIGRDNRPE